METVVILRKVTLVSVKSVEGRVMVDEEIGTIYINLKQIVTLEIGKGYYYIKMSNGENHSILPKNEIFKQED